ncbi:Proteasome subunit beta type 5 [Trichuris trichiura]|uniref:Proteasome subunit beta type 5 n=1 Tax=Trichuris trichiura TaxID=36087 RepID=A0A077ZAD9_TRITR|nr:Proteasome subunit beta type 5 [Trichuris trichiura]
MAMLKSLRCTDLYGDDIESEMRKDCMLSTDPKGVMSLPPNVRDVSGFVSQHLTGVKMHMLKGTTTLGFVYEGKTPNDKGGVIVAVDSRASSGKYVSSSTVMKIIELTDCMVSTLAGGAADCQFWLRLLSKTCKLYEVRTKNRITASASSKILQNILCDYKNMGLSMVSIHWLFLYCRRLESHFRLARAFVQEMALYMVSDDGTRKKGKVFSTGSGSLNAYGIMDSYYKPQMTDEEAKELAQKAIMHATYRDIGSGGLVTGMYRQWDDDLDFVIAIFSLPFDAKRIYVRREKRCQRTVLRSFE